MPNIPTDIRETLTHSLFAYYETLNRGDLEAQSKLMTKESYILNLEAFGFKRAFKDQEFKTLLKQIHEDASALYTVESVLARDLAKEAREHEVALVSFESRGLQRISVHYTEDGHPKKLYFSSTTGTWLIDFKAGRRTA